MIMCALCKTAPAEYELEFGAGGFHGSTYACAKCAKRKAGSLPE